MRPRTARRARTEQPVVERDVADGDGARGRSDHLADAEVLEEIAGAGLAHYARYSLPVTPEDCIRPARHHVAVLPRQWRVR